MHRGHAQLDRPSPGVEEAAPRRVEKEEHEQQQQLRDAPSPAREQQQQQEAPIHSRADFDALLSRGDDACVVLFTSDGCSPCKRIEPSYAALRRSFDGSSVRFARAVVVGGGGGDGGRGRGQGAPPLSSPSSSPSSPSPSPSPTSSPDALASELDVSTLPTWVCLRGGGVGEVARVAGVRHKRPLQPVAAAVRRRLLLLQEPPPPSAGEE